MNRSDLTQLNGQSILVKSTADRRDPPVALRGTLNAEPGARGEPEVKIVLEYPDMCNTAAHHGIIPVPAQDVERLLAQGRDGVYEYTIDRPIEPGPEPETPQMSS
jgi:hypothetical protein